MPLSPWLRDLGRTLPILQAPMAGVSTPALAAAVTSAGALGAIAVGQLAPEAADAALCTLADHTRGPVNVNVFTHAPPRIDPVREAAWLARLEPAFEALGTHPPKALDTPYAPLDDALLDVLLVHRPRVVSTHFGAPEARHVDALHAGGTLVLGTATTVAEARALIAVGVDVVVAQGIEAGGHRGCFDPDASAELGTAELVRALRESVAVPIVAAGGLMDGHDLRRMLDLGACAGQFGTAFAASPESSASPAHRAGLVAGARTEITRAISGRPARGLVDDWMALPGDEAPDYPRAYAAGKALAATGAARWAVHWAGAEAGRARALPAGTLVERIAVELGGTEAPD